MLISINTNLSIYSSILPKRVTAITFNPSSSHVIVSDAFGDVYQLDINESINVREDEEARYLLLGHCCSIIDIAIRQNVIASADRDAKLRISSYPNSYIILSFCLGHSQFVSCIEWTAIPFQLLSAGGDANLILWDTTAGEKLSLIDLRKCQAVKQMGERVVVTKLCIMGDDVAIFTIGECSMVYAVSGLKEGKLHDVRSVTDFGTSVVTSMECIDTMLWITTSQCNVVYEYQLHTDKLECVTKHNMSCDQYVQLEIESRFEWLQKQWKKDMVDNWKGKKRRRLDK